MQGFVRGLLERLDGPDTPSFSFLCFWDVLVFPAKVIEVVDVDRSTTSTTTTPAWNSGAGIVVDSVRLPLSS